ncbi:hypothetical protein FF80_01872 [Devosia sp. LC5]|nr:hypothetical protein FF80_01872 [Devosia sp. LC5]
MSVEYADARRSGRSKRGTGLRKVTVRGVTAVSNKSPDLIAREILTARAARKVSR